MSIFKKGLTFYFYPDIIICACKNAYYRGVAQFGSFEFDRRLWRKKGERKGAAVKGHRRSKP